MTLWLTIISKASTILAVIIGAVWIGIGVPMGNDLYIYLFKKRFRAYLKGMANSHHLLRKVIRKNGRRKHG